MAGDSADRSARRMREKAQRLQSAAERYERGAEGERLTAQALEGLPADGWDVIHDVSWPGRRYANIDHIAVGRAGVFVIDSKNWTGEIAVRKGVLRQNGRRRDGAVAAAAEAAHAVAQLVPQLSPTHVHGVLCFVGEHHITGWAQSTMLCSTRNVATMLDSRPPVLMSALREDVVRRLREQVASPAPSPPRALTARRRWRVPATFLSSIVGGLVAVGILLALTHPEIADRVGDLVVSIVGSDDSSQQPQHQHPHR